MAPVMLLVACKKVVGIVVLVTLARVVPGILAPPTTGEECALADESLRFGSAWFLQTLAAPLVAYKKVVVRINRT